MAMQAFPKLLCVGATIAGDLLKWLESTEKLTVPHANGGEKACPSGLKYPLLRPNFRTSLLQQLFCVSFRLAQSLALPNFGSLRRLPQLQARTFNWSLVLLINQPEGSNEPWHPTS